jgi:hypothetical protein
MPISGNSRLWSRSRVALPLDFAKPLGESLQCAEVEMLVRHPNANRTRPENAFSELLRQVGAEYGRAEYRTRRFDQHGFPLSTQAT